LLTCPELFYKQNCVAHGHPQGSLSASEVTTLWRYTNLFIITIIIIIIIVVVIIKSNYSNFQASTTLLIIRAQVIVTNPNIMREYKTTQNATKIEKKNGGIS